NGRYGHVYEHVRHVKRLEAELRGTRETDNSKWAWGTKPSTGIRALRVACLISHSTPHTSDFIVECGALSVGKQARHALAWFCIRHSSPHTPLSSSPGIGYPCGGRAQIGPLLKLP